MTIRHPMRSATLGTVTLIALALASACSSDSTDSPATGSSGGSAGRPSTGGASAAATGGNLSGPGSGGTSGGAGGSATPSGGRTATSGGSAGKAGGGKATGGTMPSSGGRAASAGNGGASATGGKAAAGAASAGKSSSGGSAGEPGGGDGGVATGTGGSGGGSERPGWTLVFSEEFNDASGTPVDSKNWNVVNRGDGFGNNELQYYTTRPENAAQDGKGSLVITAIEESYMGRDYTSARLESNGKIELHYGRVEGRLKLPYGQGIWPAFWMLGADFKSAGWPNCGEIDIMENIGKEPTITHGTLHGPGYSGGSPLGASYELSNGARFADDFHTFAVEWEEDVVRFYVDDELFKTRTPADVPDGARWVYDHPFYLLLNVAVGGSWPGSPDGSTTFPQKLLIDYIRVYER